MFKQRSSSKKVESHRYANPYDSDNAPRLKVSEFDSSGQFNRESNLDGSKTNEAESNFFNRRSTLNPIISNIPATVSPMNHDSQANYEER